MFAVDIDVTSEFLRLYDENEEDKNVISKRFQTIFKAGLKFILFFLYPKFFVLKKQLTKYLFKSLKL